MKHSIGLLLVLLLMGWTTPIMAQQWGLSVKYLFDSRGYNTLGVWPQAELPYGFSLWGFTDLHGNEGKGSRFDLTRSFSEYRLSYPLLKNLRAEVEYNGFTPQGVDLLRFGGTYQLNLFDGQVWLRGFPLETDGRGGEVSIEWDMPLFWRLHFSGWLDLDIEAEKGKDLWFTEPALTVDLTDKLSLIIEGRFNGFEQRLGMESGGVAVGLGYVLR